MTPKTPAMNATVATVKALSATLKRVGKVVPGKMTLPVLSTVLVEAVPGRGIRVTGTDLDVALRAKLEAKVEAGGRVAVPLKPWLKILATLPADKPVRLTVELPTAKTPRFVMECGTSRTVLVGIAAEEFPSWPTPEGNRISERAEKGKVTTTVRSVETSAAVLADLARVIPFASTDSRPVLNGVLLEIQDDNGIVSVATNGHRLARVAQSNEYKEPPMWQQLILPPDALDCAAHLSDDAPVTLTWLSHGDGMPDTRLWIETPTVEIATRLIEGPYPHWRQIWPRENNQTLTVNRKDFLTTVKRITSVASEQTHRIALEPSPYALTVSARLADVGETQETVEVTTWQGQSGMRVGANGQYLAGILTALDSELVTLTFHDNASAAPERAIVLTGADDPTIGFVFMPLRLVD
jgi:DNA polymerase-3 subunit beta